MQGIAILTWGITSFSEQGFWVFWVQIAVQSDITNLLKMLKKVHKICIQANSYIDIVDLCSINCQKMRKALKYGTVILHAFSWGMTILQKYICCVQLVASNSYAWAFSWWTKTISIVLVRLCHPTLTTGKRGELADHSAFGSLFSFSTFFVFWVFNYFGYYCGGW